WRPQGFASTPFGAAPRSFIDVDENKVRWAICGRRDQVRDTGHGPYHSIQRPTAIPDQGGPAPEWRKDQHNGLDRQTREHTGEPALSSRRLFEPVTEAAVHSELRAAGAEIFEFRVRVPGVGGSGDGAQWWPSGG